MAEPVTPLDSAAPPDPKVWARPLHERHIELLGDLAEEGREVARTLARRVAAVDGDDSLAPVEIVPLLEGLSRAYGRAGRGLRLSVILRERVIKDLIAFDAGLAPQVGLDERKDEIRQIVRIIVDPRDDPETRERLDREIMERLERERESLEAAALSWPVGENMTVILKDLGRDADIAGEAWAAEAWAGDETGGEAAGWPSAAGRSPRIGGDGFSVHKASP